ncbi:uncharacterized protein LOC144447787 [Glandiceps talaboti]
MKKNVSPGPNNRNVTTSPQARTFRRTEQDSENSSSTVYPADTISSRRTTSNGDQESVPSSSSSAGSDVKNINETYGVYILHATGDKELVRNKIVKPLEEELIEYFFEPRDCLPGYTRKQIRKKAMQFHPMTILAITANFNREIPDSEIHEVILQQKDTNIPRNLRRFVCVLLEKDATIPSLLNNGPLDFTGTAEEYEQAKAKMIRVSKKRLKHFKRKREDDTDKTEVKSSAGYMIDDDESLPNCNNVAFVSIQSGDRKEFGPHISSDILRETEAQFEHFDFDKQSHGENFLKNFVTKPPGQTIAENYLIGKVIPLAENDSDYVTLSQICCKFTERVQKAALESLGHLLCLKILSLTDLLVLESTIGVSMNTATCLLLNMQVYCNIICSLILAWACSDQTHTTALKLNFNRKLVKNSHSQKTVYKEMTLQYSKEMIQKAKATVQTISEGKTGKVLPFRKGISHFMHLIMAIDHMEDMQETEERVRELKVSLKSLSWFEQLLVFKFIAYTIYRNEDSQARKDMLAIFQRILHIKSKEAIRHFVVHISLLMVHLIMSSTDEGEKEDQIPVRYSAPESLLSYTYSEHSDAWMCSCLAYEVLTYGCPPYTELQSKSIEEILQYDIPEDLQESINVQSMYDTQPEIQWCKLDEIIGPDEPTLSENGLFYVEEVLYERSPDDNESLKALLHDNIVQISTIYRKEKILIQEYKNHGGTTLLEKCKIGGLSVDDILGYLCQVARGMAFAHSAGWVHGCLKARYITICNETAKISRWGRALCPEVRLYDTQPDQAIQVQKTQRDIERWAPPEIIQYGMFSQQGDVFMFAQVCWEAFHAQTVDISIPDEAIVPYPNKTLEQALESLRRREHQIQPPDCPDWLYI